MNFLNPSARRNLKISLCKGHFKIRLCTRKIVEFYAASRCIIQNGAYARLRNFKFDRSGSLINAAKFGRSLEWFKFS